MSDSGGCSPTQRNLARIRDNQRRSRARRKEYLQDLETKYRQCEMEGVEATAEIQAAARRVVEENRRLRALLKQKGLTDADIDGMPIDPAENPQLTSSAKALEEKLNTRRICSSGGCGSPVAADGQQNGPSLLALPKTPSLGATTRTTPSSQLSPYPIPTPIASAEDFQPRKAESLSAQHFMQSSPVSPDLQQWENFDSARYLDPAASQQAMLPDLTSCRAAADTIRAFDANGSLGPDVEAVLGCGNSCSDGRDCMVPTAQVFGILNRMPWLNH